MSGLLAIVRTDGGPTPESVVRRMLGAMSERGMERVEVFTDGGVLLAVQRYEWEFGPGFSGPVMVVQDEDAVVVADARLYYRDDLRSKLSAKGVRAQGTTASQLLLAAYRAFGEELAEELEGDFSFIIWDRRRRRLLASRDYTGGRPLFWAQTPKEIILASTVSALLEHPAVPHDLDVAQLAIDAAGAMFASDDETSYRAIRQCRAGATLLQSGSAAPWVHRWFSIASAESRDRRPRAEAAEGLRAVLGTAIHERLAVSDPTSVWVSGGFDSPAVLALSQSAAQSSSRVVRPISLSFRSGDSAREDETIAAICSHLRVDPHWVDGNAIPSIAVNDAPGGWRDDEAFTHLHADILRALAAGTRAANSRVALHGHAGDFLFYCGPSYLSDLLRHGQFMELAAEWRALEVRQERFRRFFKYAVEPLLGGVARRAVERVRGRVLVGPNEREWPTWMQTPVVQQLGVKERSRQAVPVAKSDSSSAAEFRWYFTNQGFARLSAIMTTLPLALGVEIRSPMHDLRVLRYVAAGHRSERFARGESKVLLRDAMRPLLPAAVLAARREKTGTLTTRLERSILDALPTLRRLFKDSRLADLGVIEPRVLLSAIDRLETRGTTLLVGEQLLRAGLVESWLRKRESPSPRAAGPQGTSPITPSFRIPEVVATMATFASGDSRQPHETWST